MSSSSEGRSCHIGVTRASLEVWLYGCVAVGCGSFEVSWLCCEDLAVLVFRVVDAFVLAAEVEGPVVVEVAVIPNSA